MRFLAHIRRLGGYVTFVTRRYCPASLFYRGLSRLPSLLSVLDVLLGATHAQVVALAGFVVLVRRFRADVLFRALPQHLLRGPVIYRLNRLVGFLGLCALLVLVVAFLYYHHLGVLPVD